MDVSENRGTPKSSILVGFSIIYQKFWGTPIFGNSHIVNHIVKVAEDAKKLFFGIQCLFVPWELEDFNGRIAASTVE